jgi:hypothetical protein
MKSKTSPFQRFVLLALCAVLALSPVASFAATSTAGSSAIKFAIQQTNTTDLGTASWAYSADWLKAFADGSGINQANKIYQAKITLTGSGTSTIDLDSSLTGPLATVSFSRIYLLAVRRTDTPVASTQDENVTIGGDWILTKYLIPGADTLSAVTLPLRPGGTFFIVAPDATGIAVTATTGDQVTFTNSSSADTTHLEVVVIGS